MTATTPPHRQAEAKARDLLAADDQSVLADGWVCAWDPTPGAWSRHTPPQSPLGQVLFPEVMRIVTGQVHRLIEPGRLEQHHLLARRWLPWSLQATGPELTVTRVVDRSVFAARLTVDDDRPAMLTLRLAANLPVELRDIGDTGVTFRWARGFDIALRITGGEPALLSDDESTLLAGFAGADAEMRFNSDHVLWHWKTYRRCAVAVPFATGVEVRFSVAPIGELRPEQPIERMIDRQVQRWCAALDRWPRCPDPSPVRRRLWALAWHNLVINECPGGAGATLRPYTSPSRLHYGSQWWWDEAFHAIVYRHLDDPVTLFSRFDNFIAAQQPDGAIPGCLRFTDDRALSFESGGMTMQPPVIGVFLQLMEREDRWPDDLTIVRPLYDALLRHVDWLTSPARDVDRDGLIEYHHSFDSSADQTQRWDSQKIDPNQTVGPLRPVEPVDANVWLACLGDALANLAKRFGDEATRASMTRRRDRIVDLIEERMWDESDGFYYDLDAVTHRKIRVRTVHGFMPLLIERFDRRRLDRLVNQHLCDPRAFWPRFPIPSTAMDHHDFDPEDMWRGPTWINMNWLVFEALLRRRRSDLARDLAERTCELVGPRPSRQGDPPRSSRFHEWFHPLTGRPLGNASYAWSSLVLDMLQRIGPPTSTRRPEPSAGP